MSTVQKKPMTIDEYAVNIKTTVFGMTGALGSRMEKIVDELLSAVMESNNKIKLQSEENTKKLDEIIRLQELLKQNKIPYEKLPNGKVKVEQPKVKQ